MPTNGSDPGSIAARVRRHLAGVDCDLKARGAHLGKPGDGGYIVAGADAGPERLTVTFRGIPYDKVTLLGGLRPSPPPILIVNCPWDVRVDESGLRVFDAQLVHLDSGNGGPHALVDAWRDTDDWIVRGLDADGSVRRVTRDAANAIPIFELVALRRLSGR